MPFNNGISNTPNAEKIPEHFYADYIGNHSEMSGNMGDLTSWMYAK